MGRKNKEKPEIYVYKHTNVHVMYTGVKICKQFFHITIIKSICHLTQLVLLISTKVIIFNSP